MEPTYDELTQRNIGVVTREEQERISRLSIVIAGCGAIGAPAAIFLARLGVGELRLADPEEFEPSNANRQFAAYVDTMGLNKAEAVAAEVRRINPGIVLQTFPGGVSAESVGALLGGADAVVDGLDFFELEAEVLLHREAAARGLWVFTSQGVVEITSITSFDPARPALEDMVCDQGRPSIARAIESFFPVLPKAATPELIAAAAAGELPAVPSDVTGSGFGGSFLVEDILRVMVRRQPAAAVAPDLYVFDQDSLWLRFWDAGSRSWSTR